MHPIGSRDRERIWDWQLLLEAGRLFDLEIEDVI
jgi:hypothetical protein